MALTAPDGPAPAEPAPAEPAPDERLPATGFREALRSGVGPRLATTLLVLALLDEVDRASLFVLGPDIQRTLHLSDAKLGGVVSASALLLTILGLPIGVLADRRRRVTVAGVCAIVAGCCTALTGAARGYGQILVVRLATGAGQASVLPVHNGLLADGYPPASRPRVMALHNTAAPTAKIVAPAAAGGIAALAGGSAGWRWPFLVTGALLVLAGSRALRLAEPRREQAVTAARDPVLQTVRELLRIPGLRPLLLSIGVLGFSIVGTPTFVNLLFKDHYGLGAFRRGLLDGIAQVGSLCGVAIGSQLAARLPLRGRVRALAIVLPAYGVVLLGALSLQPLGLLVAGLALANVLGSAAVVPYYTSVAALVPDPARSTGFALMGVSVAVVGGVFGTVLLGAISDAAGPRVALASVIPVAGIGAGALAALAAARLHRDSSP